MSIPYKNMAPTCVVLAMALFCCWPYAEQPLVTDDSPEVTKLRNIADSMIAVTQSSKRNPFKLISAAISEPSDEDAKQLAQPVVSQLQVDDFTLDATFVGTTTSSAVIDGTYYSVGDQLAHRDLNDVRLMRVEARRVILSSNGETYVLRYSTPLGPKAPTRPYNDAVGQSKAQARSARERNEQPARSIADLLFRSARIANDLHGQDKEKSP